VEQQVQFCRSADHVRIAFAVSGHGPPLVKAANYLTISNMIGTALSGGTGCRPV